ncbi:hypothetical protein ACOSP7_004996 [Xanthoceras sorbifolium]
MWVLNYFFFFYFFWLFVSCYNHFMWMHHDMTFLGVLVHELLLREIWHDSPRDEMRFCLGQHTVRLLRVDYINHRDDVTIDNVKDTLEPDRFGAPDDALKLLLILVLHKFLYGSNNCDILLLGNAPGKHPKEKYNLYDFVWALQVITSLAAKLTTHSEVEDILPRILKWSFSKRQAS